MKHKAVFSYSEACAGLDPGWSWNPATLIFQTY